MRLLLVTALILLTARLPAQQDYFYAQTLINNGQHAEAVRVLDHLIDSGAYAGQPRFAMMMLNLAGTTKQSLHDTVGAKKCFEAAMLCYDTLSKPHKSDDWNHREYYVAGEELAWIYYHSGEYSTANNLLLRIDYPGWYYSSNDSVRADAQTGYCRLRSFIFQKINQPDSAFKWILRIRDHNNPIVDQFDSIFNVEANNLTNVRCVPYTQKSTNEKIASPGYLFFAAWSDEKNTQHSIWFVNPESETIHIIGKSTYNMEDPHNFPANCYDMSLSPDEKYLAVTCYTEGSNHIDIYSFPEILNEYRCVMKESIEAYPASVEIKGWENSMLIIESEADLTRLNKRERLSLSDYPKGDEPKERFLFDVESGKYIKK